jgi:hypothetical protein
MERLDEKYEKLPQQPPLLTKAPSEYVKDGSIYFSIPHFRAREDLSERVKKLILRDNCIDFYSLKAVGL